MKNLFTPLFALAFLGHLTAQDVIDHIPRALQRAAEINANKTTTTVEYQSRKSEAMVREYSQRVNEDDYTKLATNWLSVFNTMRSQFNISVTYQMSHSINSISNVSDAKVYGNLILFEYLPEGKPQSKIAIPAQTILMVMENHDN